MFARTEERHPLVALGINMLEFVVEMQSVLSVKYSTAQPCLSNLFQNSV